MADGTVTCEIAIAAFVVVVLTVRYGQPLSANTSAVNVQEICSQYGGPLPSGSTQYLEAWLECRCCGFQYAPHFPACYLDVLSR